MTGLNNIMLATAIGAALLFPAWRLGAKPEFSKKEKTACATCHVKNGSKELNQKGTYYKSNKSLPPGK